MAEAALLLHGFTGTPESFRPFIEHLHPSWNCYCPALPGHGRTPGPLAPRGFREAVAEFFAHVDRGFDARGTKLHLVGYSLGARVALGLIEQFPRHFASATLVGVHPGLTNAAERAARHATDLRWCQVLRERGVEGFCDEWESQTLFASQRALPAAERDLQRLSRTSHTASGLVWSFETFGLARMPSYHDLLQAPPVPIRLVVGELDAKFLAIAKGLAAGNKQLGPTIFPGGGHNLVLEQPRALAEAFVQGATND